MATWVLDDATMRHRLTMWLDDLGRHILKHGWSDPFCSIAPIEVLQRLDHEDTDGCDRGAEPVRQLSNR